MKVLIGFCVLLFIFKNVDVDASPKRSSTSSYQLGAGEMLPSKEVLEYDTDEGLQINIAPDTSPTTPQTSPTTEKSQPATSSDSTNDLSGISIQDVLLSGVDGTDKINKKIANTLVEFSTNPKNYEDIELKLSGYSFPKKLVQLSIPNRNVSFYNLKLSHTDYGYSIFTTEIGCDVGGNTKMQVSLPEALQLIANLTIRDITKGIKEEGSISITFWNGNLLRRSKIATNKITEVEITSKIVFNNSTVQLDVDNRYQSVVYEQLSTFLNETESSLSQYLLEQLNEEIIKRNIILASSCSKLTRVDHRQRKISLPFLNNYVNSLYLIQNTKVETWRSVTLNAGPVIIEGLQDFTGAESIVSYQHKTNDYNNPRYDSIKVVLKTGNLKGKFEWYYDLERSESNRPLVFAFFIDNVQIENQVKRRYNFNYRQFETETIGVKVNVGKINVKPFESRSTSDYEGKFVNIVLSEYLGLAIKQSLNDSITEEIKMRSSSLINLFDN